MAIKALRLPVRPLRVDKSQMAARQVVQGEGWQSEKIHLLHHRMPLEELRHLLRIAAHKLHLAAQRLDLRQGESTVYGRKAWPEVPRRKLFAV